MGFQTTEEIIKEEYSQENISPQFSLYHDRVTPPTRSLTTQEQILYASPKQNQGRTLLQQWVSEEDNQMERNDLFQQEMQHLASELDKVKLNLIDCNSQRIEANHKSYRHEQTIAKLQANIQEYGQATFDLGNNNQVLRQRIEFLELSSQALERLKLNPAQVRPIKTQIKALLADGMTVQKLKNFLERMDS